MAAPWWVWVVAGLALAALEVLAAGYVFLGLAVGAVATGALIGLGVLGGGLPLALLAFALASLAAWGALRLALGRPRGDVKVWEKDIND